MTALSYTHGGALDLPKGRTRIDIGHVEKPPAYDEKNGVVSHALLQVGVDEGAYVAVTLPPGRYWLFSSTGSHVVLLSCSAKGVSEVQPRS